jgi:predicted ATPase
MGGKLPQPSPRRGACEALPQRREDARRHARKVSPCLWPGPEAAPTHGAQRSWPLTHDESHSGGKEGGLCGSGGRGEPQQRPLAALRAASDIRACPLPQPLGAGVYLCRRRVGHVAAGAGARAGADGLSRAGPGAGAARGLLGRVCRGMGQVLCLVGEAGIGKSRLAYECQRTLGAARWLTVQALSYAQTMPYQAVLPLLRTVFGVVETADPAHQRQAIQTRLAALTPPLTEDAPLLAQLLGVPLAPEGLPALSPEAQRRQLQQACLQGLIQQAADSPLGLLVEDGHWLDPSSQELLDLLVASLARRAMVVLCTARPGFQPGWSAYAYFHQVAIEPLAVEETEAMVCDLLQPHAASAELHALIWERTRGNPFFVEELVRAMQAHGLLIVHDGVFEVTGNPRRMLPVSIQGVVQARLDQLPPEDKRLVQVAAVIGPEVPLPLLQALAELSEDGLHRSLTRLQAAWLYEARTFPTPIYTFTHTLVQEVAYQSLLQPTRQYYHERIVQVLTARFSETAETQPELVAHHATAAGWSAQAIASWQRAGEMALARSAHVEATTHFRRGLELLLTLPETSARAQTELVLQRALSTSLLLTRGFAAPEVVQVYGRARALCEQVGDTAQHFPVLFGLRGFYEARGELQTAWELGEQLLALAQHEPNATDRLQAHRALGDTAFWLGEFGLARAHLEQAIALHDPQQHAIVTFRDGQDHGIVSRAFLPRVLWVQGYPEQALTRSLEVLMLVHDRSHPFNLAVALNAAAMIHQLRRESAAVRARAEALLALCQEQHFALYGATGTVQRGWALVCQGQHAEGRAQLLAGLEAYRTTGAVLIQPYFLALLAQAHTEAGQTAEGLGVLEDALTLMHKTG